ncbi:Protein of unknown function [Gryllus bimaculatus]|nr:Protein of unknown function [Gryllus bimaculatus]
MKYKRISCSRETQAVQTNESDAEHTARGHRVQPRQPGPFSHGRQALPVTSQEKVGSDRGGDGEDYGGRTDGERKNDRPPGEIRRNLGAGKTEPQRLKGEQKKTMRTARGCTAVSDAENIDKAKP